MGFKSKSKNTNQSNIYNPFKIGGLIFDSEDDYQLLKNIDINISETVKAVENGVIDIQEVFNNIKKINVRETYYDADEEMDGLFSNATGLLCYEGTRFDTHCKVGRCFFRKINVIPFCIDDSDSEYDI